MSVDKDITNELRASRTEPQAQRAAGMETVIGLEIHSELSTQSKLFCGCATSFGADLNEHTCPVCLGMPGALPVLNKKAVEYTVKAGLAMHCAITERGRQDRKNYFYPDLPKAYQISQLDAPLCVGGHLTLTDEDGVVRQIRFNRIHLEEDAGKLLHGGAGGTRVDLNRGGTPLIEIVTEPDLRSAAEARDLFAAVRELLTYIGVSDCRMEEGSLRCDVNVSLRPCGQEEYGTRTEMKNLNSLRSVYRAIESEVARQTEILQAGGVVVQETRRWDDDAGESSSMRSKEEAMDYRYFPDPDLGTIVVTPAMVEQWRGEMPELPEARRARYQSDHDLSAYDAGQLTANRAVSDYFEAAMACGAAAKSVANRLMGDIAMLLKDTEDVVPPFPPSALAAVCKHTDTGNINSSASRALFKALFADPAAEVDALIESLGLAQVSDTGALETIAREVIAANPQSVADFKAGKDKAIGFLVGQCMKASKGKGNPGVLQTIIRQLIIDS